MTKRLIATVASAVAVTLGVGLVGAPAQAAPLKTRSLAAVLTSDGNHFDRNSRDFDITTEAVLAVLAAKPDSPVAVLADGKQALTAFVPTDLAFRRLARDLTGRTIHSERKIFTTLAGSLGIDTIESVLLYHVVPGARINRKAALGSDDAELTTAAELPVTVNVLKRPTRVRLVDLDPDDLNAKVVKFDLNRGNRQLAHGVDRVLRPADL